MVPADSAQRAHVNWLLCLIWGSAAYVIHMLDKAATLDQSLWITGYLGGRQRVAAVPRTDEVAVPTRAPAIT